MKKAMTLLEILIAMTLLVAASILIMNVLNMYINKDTDVAKFKHAFGTFSEVIYSLKNDTCMYPTTKGFADSKIYKCSTNEKEYDKINYNTSQYQTDKFRRLFTSKFNVLEGNIQLKKLSSKIPYIEFKENGTEGYLSYNSAKCFIENKGFMFCPPVFSLVDDQSLEGIFIPIYVNNIDLSDSATYDVNKAIFTKVANNGKIEIPPKVYNGKDSILIDCTDEKFNNYSHCKILDKMLDMDF